MPLLCAVDRPPARSSFSQACEFFSQSRRAPPSAQCAARVRGLCTARLHRRRRGRARCDARGDQQAGGAPRALGGDAALRTRGRASRADLRGGALRGGPRLRARPRRAEHRGAAGDGHRPAAAGPADHHRLGGRPSGSCRGSRRSGPRTPGWRCGSARAGSSFRSAARVDPSSPSGSAADPWAGVRAEPLMTDDAVVVVGSLGRRPAQDSGGPGACHLAPRRGSPACPGSCGWRPPAWDDRRGDTAVHGSRTGGSCCRPPGRGRASRSRGGGSRSALLRTGALVQPFPTRVPLGPELLAGLAAPGNAAQPRSAGARRPGSGRRRAKRSPRRQSVSITTSMTPKQRPLRIGSCPEADSRPRQAAPAAPG